VSIRTYLGLAPAPLPPTPRPHFPLVRTPDSPAIASCGIARPYRKRFYRHRRLEFDLRTLACEHVGLSRSYQPTELKRRLRPAPEELEASGFLEPLTPEERYAWAAQGRWQILLIRGAWGRAEAGAAPAGGAAELAAALTARGVSPKVAAELVGGQTPGRLRTKLEVFDWLVKDQDKRVGKNPAGYLVASIRADYHPPGDFPAVAPAVAPGDSPAGAAAAEGTRRGPDRAAAEAARAHERALRARWDALPEARRAAILDRVRAENPGLVRWPKMIVPLCWAALEAEAEAEAG
jgi:hypothetical protein